MTLLANVREDWKEARKARATQKANLLTLVIAGAEKRAKDDKKSPGREVTDDDVIATINSLSGDIKQYFDKPEIASRLSEDDRLLKELELEQLQSYLPKQLSEKEIRKELEDLKAAQGDKLSIGSIMGYFKKSFAYGSYDQRLVSTLAVGFLKK